MKPNSTAIRRLAALALVATASLAAAACASPAPTTTAGSPARSGPATSGSMDPGMTMGPSASTPAAAVTVHIHAFSYSDPGPVAPGTTITVMNMDPEAHTVTADGGAFNVTAPPGQSVTFTAPTKPGTYPYHCQYHSDMHATLTVK